LGFIFRSIKGEHFIAIGMNLAFGVGALMSVVSWYRGRQVWDALGTHARMGRTGSFEKIE